MVAIDSLLPNPVGPDTGAEWIKLVNRGSETLNLSGWSLKDASGKTFVLKGELAPQDGLTFKNSQTKIILNNDADTVSLYDQSGKLVDSLSYENPAEGEIVTRIGTDTSAASARPSPAIIDSGRTIPSVASDFTPLAAGLLTAIIMGAIAAYVAKYLGAENSDGRLRS